MSDILFFGKDRKVEWLSNHSKHKFQDERGDWWATVEHYFQAKKFEGDGAYQEEIRLACTSQEAKRLGQSREHQLREDYEDTKDDIMRSAIRLKFREHSALVRRLLGTGAAYLAEESDTDAYWGTPRDLSGANRLGALLMELRTDLGGCQMPKKPKAEAGSAPASRTGFSSTPQPPSGGGTDTQGGGKKVYHAAVVVVPPEGLWEQIQAVREKHDKAYVRWMPHINLMFPFLDEASYNALGVTRGFEEALTAIEPFEVELSDFGQFQHKAAVLYCKPKASPAPDGLHRLQEALRTVVPVCDELNNRSANGFTPHLTLGQFNAHAARRKAEELRRTWKPIRWTCDKVLVIRREGDTPFTVANTISLGHVSNKGLNFHIAEAAAQDGCRAEVMGRVVTWAERMTKQGQLLPRSVPKLINAVKNMCHISYQADHEAMFARLQREGYFRVVDGKVLLSASSVPEIRQPYEVIGQTYVYSSGFETSYVPEGETPQLLVPTDEELKDMAHDRLVRWVRGLKRESALLKGFQGQFQQVAALKVLLDAKAVVQALVDTKKIEVSEDDCHRIVAYHL